MKNIEKCFLFYSNTLFRMLLNIQKLTSLSANFISDSLNNTQEPIKNGSKQNFEHTPILKN